MKIFHLIIMFTMAVLLSGCYVTAGGHHGSRVVVQPSVIYKPIPHNRYHKVQKHRHRNWRHGRRHHHR